MRGEVSKSEWSVLQGYLQITPQVLTARFFSKETKEKIVRALISVDDPLGDPKVHIADIYSYRCEIEFGVSEMKQHLQNNELRLISQKSQLVEQEPSGLVYNLRRFMMV